MSDPIEIILRIKDQASGPVKTVTSSINDLDKTAQSTTARGLSGLQDAIGTGIKVAVGVGITALAGLTAAISKSVIGAADMEQGVADIRATMGLTAEQTAELKDLITDLGLDPKLKVSAVEASAAIDMLGKNGLSVEEIMSGAARSTVLLANAVGDKGFALSADVATDVMAQFNIAAEDMDKAVNGIVGVTKSSKFDINDYALALAQAGGIASSVGVEFDDFNAAIAAISPLFGSGSDAGTSFKTFLTSLIPKSNEAQDTMRDLGLYTGSSAKQFKDAQEKIDKYELAMAKLDPTSKNYSARLSELQDKIKAQQDLLVIGQNAFFDTEGNLKDITEITRLLTDATAGLSEEQKNNAFSTIFGSDAMRAAFGLVNAGVPEIERLKQAIGDTSAEESAAIRMDTFKGALEIAMGVIETISLSIGDKFLPVLRPLIERFTELAQVYGPMVVDFFGKFADGLATFVDGVLPRGNEEFAKVADVISGLTGTFGGAASATSDLITAITGGTNASAEMSTAFKSGAEAGMLVREMLGVTAEATDTTSRGFWGLIDGVKGFIAPVVNAITQFVSWKDVLTVVGGVIASIVIPAVYGFLTAITPAIAVFTGLVAASALLRNAWESDFLGIQTVTVEVWGIISGIFHSAMTMIGGIVETFKAQWAILAETNASLGEKLALSWNLIKDVANAAWQGIVTAVQILWPQFVEAVTQWSAAAWQWIVDAIPVAKQMLSEWGVAIVGWLGENLPKFIRTVLEWGTALYTWIGDAIPKAIDALADYIKGIREKGDGDGKSGFMSMAGQWADALWRWITDDLIPAVRPAFNSFIESVMNYGSRLLSSLGNLAVQLGLLLWEWIVDVTPIALKKLGDWGSELWGWIKDMAPAWYDHLAEWGKLAWEWITKVAIPEALDKLAEWGGELWDWITENAPKLWDALMEWAGNLWGWILEVAWPATRDAIAEWANNLWDWITENAPIWWENFKTLGSNMMNNLWDGFEQKWIEFNHWFVSETGMGKFIGNLFSMFGVQLGPLYGVIEEDGRQIVYSLRKGVDSKLDEIHQAGASMGNSLQTGLRTNLDMHSPSRVIWGYGEDVVAGLTGAINAGLPQIAGAGASMGRSLGNGLKSEVQYVAEQVKAMMARTTSEINGYVDYFTKQAAIKAQTVSTQIASAAKDASAILKQLGIDTSSVIGYGPNGELILKGVTNLPGGSKPTTGGGTDSGGNFVPTETEKTTLAEALGLDKITGSAAAQSTEILGGITLSATDIAGAKKSMAAAKDDANKKLLDYAAGVGDFLKDTLGAAQNVFRKFALMEQKIIQEEGSLKGYVTSEAYSAKQSVSSLYTSLKYTVADILGVSRADLNVDSLSSGGLISKITELVTGTNADTDIKLIGQLLQEAVDFRNTANYGLGSTYYKDVLPTDSRITGGNTTNNYNVTLTGTNNPNNDLLGAIQLLNQLSMTVSP